MKKAPFNGPMLARAVWVMSLLREDPQMKAYITVERDLHDMQNEAISLGERMSGRELKVFLYLKGLEISFSKSTSMSNGSTQEGLTQGVQGVDTFIAAETCAAMRDEDVFDVSFEGAQRRKCSEYLEMSRSFRD